MCPFTGRQIRFIVVLPERFDRCVQVVSSTLGLILLVVLFSTAFALFLSLLGRSSLFTEAAATKDG